MAQWIKVKRIATFTSVPYGGVPAWVVMSASTLSDAMMKKLVHELNPFSETAFVLPEETSEADICIRFFTGSGEVNFSGHAAIAAYFALSGEDILSLEGPQTTVRQRTKTGIQQVELRLKGDRITRATIALPKPNYVDMDISLDTVAKFLGLEASAITSTELPCDMISVGTYDLIVPVAALSHMKKINPLYSVMESYCKKLGTQGITVFCTETFDRGSTAFMRHFEPLQEYKEEPISAAAAGALGSYMVRHKLTKGANFTRMIIEQGHLLQHAGKIYVHIECTREQILRIKVGGSAVCTFTGYVLAP